MCAALWQALRATVAHKRLSARQVVLACSLQLLVHIQPMQMLRHKHVARWGLLHWMLML